jgi:hypothetical protein
VTGTFAGYLGNSASNRTQPFTFTINSADTFEQKSVTITGDTTGTWLTNNGTGIELGITLGAGSDYNGTVGAWAAAEDYSVSGATNLLATSGATFYITGVQLEAGSVATPFERRDYGRELALCLRYFERFAPGLANAVTVYVGSYASDPGGSAGTWWFKQEKRAVPTISLGAGSAGVNSTSRAHVGVFATINTYATIITPATASAEL